MLSRSFLLAALATTCVAQNDPLASISQALGSNGLTAFAGLLPALNQSSIGQRLFQTLLSGGNFSLFIPNNEAISRVPQDVASNADLLANIVSYHVLQGNFTDASGTITSPNLPNVTVGRTLLNDSSLVQLEGNRAQVLIWGKESDGAIRILNQPNTTTARKVTDFGSLGIYTINHVLTPPPSFSGALAATPELTTDAIVGLLNNTSVTGPDGNNVSLTNYLDTSARGFTFFAPNNAALQAAQSTLASLQGNETAVSIVLGNHIVNGSSLYSTTLTNTTSASGQPLTFFANSSGTFVSSGDIATARIVATNVLLKNGVAHIIDGVLANTQSDPGAASSAFNQATSTASQTASETGPITTPTGSSGGNGNSASLVKENMVASILAVVGTMAFIL